MVKPLQIIAFAAIFTFPAGMASADIFVGGNSNKNTLSGSGGGSIFLDRAPAGTGGIGNRQKNSADRPIFVKPNSGTDRRVPNYAITNNKDTSSREAIGFDNTAERLQARKLREARMQEKYKRNRRESINLQTLPEEFARQYRGTSLSDLMDNSAYTAAMAADIQARQELTQTGVEQGFGDLAEKTAQQMTQATGQAQAKSDAAARQKQQESGNITDPRNTTRGRGSRTYIP